MELNSVIKLVISIITCLAAGGIGIIFTFNAIPTWYAGLKKPPFTPPNRVFGPVWTTLYILMGISLFLVWKQGVSKERNRAILIFSLQLLLNFAWSFIFFYFHMIGFALVEIILLWVSIVIMLVFFYKVKPVASYINIPCLLSM